MDFLPGKTGERVIRRKDAAGCVGIRHFLECLAPLLPYFLTGALVVFLTIIFMPAGDFILFCLLFLLVHVLHWGRMGLFRLLMLILGLPSHENLLKSNISFASPPALILDRNMPASLQMPCGSANIPAVALPLRSLIVPVGMRSNTDRRFTDKTLKGGAHVVPMQSSKPQL